MIAWAVTRLAGAGLAEDGQRLARRHGEADAVDGLGDAVAGAELDVQVLDLEQRRAGGRASGHGVDRWRSLRSSVMAPHRSFGSKASRSASPSMMKASTVTTRTAHGKSSRCGRLADVVLALRRSSMPQEIAGGCSPTPRNDSVASAAMKRAERDRGDHDDRRERVGQDVPEHDPAVRRAQHPRRLHVVLVLRRDHADRMIRAIGGPAEDDQHEDHAPRCSAVLAAAARKTMRAEQERERRRRCR